MVSEAQAESAKARAEVATLTRENARLIELVSVQEASLREAGADLDREKAQKEEIEGTLRRTVAELLAARKVALERGQVPEAGATTTRAPGADVCQGSACASGS